MTIHRCFRPETQGKRGRLCDEFAKGERLAMALHLRMIAIPEESALASDGAARLPRRLLRWLRFCGLDLARTSECRRHVCPKPTSMCGAVDRTLARLSVSMHTECLAFSSGSANLSWAQWFPLFVSSCSFGQSPFH